MKRFFLLVPLLLLATPALALDDETAIRQLPPILQTEHIRGDKHAPVALVEYSDFQCPFCRRHIRTMQTLLRRNRLNVNWVYRPLPLSFHEHAAIDAAGAQCAADLGGENAFWKYHDLLFTSQDQARSSNIDHLTSLAVKLKLDAAAFRACLNNGTHEQEAQDAEKKAMAISINGTPTTFVVNRRTGKVTLISGALPLRTFQDAIDATLADLRALPPPTQ